MSSLSSRSSNSTRRNASPRTKRAPTLGSLRRAVGVEGVTSTDRARGRLARSSRESRKARMSARDARGTARGEGADLRPRSGMSPEEVTLDLAGTDEFSVACQSLPPYGSASAQRFSPCNDPRRRHEASAHVRWYQEPEHPERTGRPPGQTDQRGQRPLHPHRDVRAPMGRSRREGMASSSADKNPAARCASWAGSPWECWS